MLQQGFQAMAKKGHNNTIFSGEKQHGEIQGFGK